MVLGLFDRVFGKMKDACGQHRVGLAEQDAIGQMVQRADSAGGNDRNSTASLMARVSSKVETAFGAVAVHAGQQDFPRRKHSSAAPIRRRRCQWAGGRRG